MNRRQGTCLGCCSEAGLTVGDVLVAMKRRIYTLDPAMQW